MNGELSDLATRARRHAALGEPARLAIVDALMLGDASPGALARSLAMPTNLLAHHLGVLQEAGLITRARSEGDKRRSYVRLVHGAAPGLPATAPPMPARVLFVCTRNSARSQLATGLWRARSTIPSTSAGTEPARRIHPRAAGVARRHGLSLRNARPVGVADVLRDGDLVVAVCDIAHETLGGDQAGRVHWSVPDPAPVDTDAAFEAAYLDLLHRVDALAAVLQRDS